VLKLGNQPLTVVVPVVGRQVARTGSVDFGEFDPTVLVDLGSSENLSRFLFSYELPPLLERAAAERARRRLILAVRVTRGMRSTHDQSVAP
jgi:hypothetical protein